MSIFEISNTKEEKPIKIRGKGKHGVIGEYYKGNKKLKRIIISKSVKRVSHHAFADCENLKEIIFDENVKLDDICSYAFYNCLGLKEITFPSSLKYISNWAFKNCSNLEKVIFTDNVEIVNLFDLTKKDNAVLKKEIISNNLFSIGYAAFENCVKLKEIVLPQGIKNIYAQAFYNCKSLEKIVIPSSVYSVGCNVFGLCDNLEEAVLNEGLKELNLLAFNSCHKLKKVIIPSSVQKVSVDLEHYYNEDIPDIVDLDSTEFYSREINERFIRDINYYNDKSSGETVARSFTKYLYIKNAIDKNFYGLNKNELMQYKGLIVDVLTEELCSKYPYIKKKLLDLVNIKFKIREYEDKNVDFEEQYAYFIQYCNNYLFSNNNRQMTNSNVSETLGISDNHSKVNSALSVSSKPVDEFVPWYWMDQSNVYNREDYANISDNIPTAVSELIDEESLLLKQLGITKNDLGYWKNGDIIPELKVMDEMKALKRYNDLRKFS
ncbi:MAG: leucine-rich repeat domain-containing protein [Bacilli bacterium]|nr:leucine-rich repeat domain-containing protein [Bacilli bacterium]